MRYLVTCASDYRMMDKDYSEYGLELFDHCEENDGYDEIKGYSVNVNSIEDLNNFINLWKCKKIVVRTAYDIYNYYLDALGLSEEIFNSKFNGQIIIYDDYIE